MNEITTAIAARHAQIKALQADIDALQRAASVLGEKTTAKATRQPKPKSKPKRKRRKLSAAAKKMISEKVKASWARRKRAGR